MEDWYSRRKVEESADNAYQHAVRHTLPGSVIQTQPNVSAVNWRGVLAMVTETSEHGVKVVTVTPDPRPQMLANALPWGTFVLVGQARWTPFVCRRPKLPEDPTNGIANVKLSSVVQVVPTYHEECWRGCLGMVFHIEATPVIALDRPCVTLISLAPDVGRTSALTTKVPWNAFVLIGSGKWLPRV